MQEVVAHDATELAAAFLQTGITVGVAAVCVFLYARYRRPYFAIWALAWILYAIRLGAIISLPSPFVRLNHKLSCQAGSVVDCVKCIVRLIFGMRVLDRSVVVIVLCDLTPYFVEK